MSSATNLFQKRDEVAYNFLVVNDNPAIIPDRLDNGRVSNCEMRTLSQEQRSP